MLWSILTILYFLYKFCEGLNGSLLVYIPLLIDVIQLVHYFFVFFVDLIEFFFRFVNWFFQFPISSFFLVIFFLFNADFKFQALDIVS